MFYGQDPHSFRAECHNVCEIAGRLLQNEDELFAALMAIDERRTYVRFGYKALRPFCVEALKLSRIQSQRIVTEVRRRRWAAHPQSVANHASP